MNNKLPSILQVLIGLYLLVSAGLKLLDLDGFGVQVMAYKIILEGGVVRVLVPFLVALEVALGLGLVAGLWRRWVLPATIALLLGFTGAIMYAWLVHDLKSCGCLGAGIDLHPSVSITKNLALIGALAFCLVKGQADEKALGLRLGAAAALWLTILVPASLAIGIFAGRGSAPAQTAVQASYTPPKRSLEPTPTAEPAPQETAAAAPADTGGPFARFVFETPDGPIDLGTGDHFVAFLSATCEHCEEAMEPLNFLLGVLPNIPPPVGLIMGTEAEIAAFAEKTAPEMPLFRIDPLVFMEYIGASPPRFCLVRGGESVHHWDMEAPGDVEMLEALAALGL